MEEGEGEGGHMRGEVEGGGRKKREGTGGLGGLGGGSEGRRR